MGLLKDDTKKAVGHWVLQALRVCTVMALLIAAAASLLLMIKVNRRTEAFWVFEATSLCFMSILSVALIVVEFPTIQIVQDYFRQTWPVFSDGYGIGWLGAAVISIGVHLLGALNKSASEVDSLGVHFHGTAEAAGILCLIFGVLNVLGSLIFRISGEGLTSRDIRRNGSLARGREELPSTYTGSPASSVHNEKTSRLSFWKKSAPKEDAAGKTTFPPISGPIYTHQTERNPPPTYAPSSPEPSHYEPKESPVVPGVMRPPTAEHPMMSSGLQAPAPTLKPHHTGTSSIYSSDNRRQYNDRYSAVSYNHF